jgi:hypothetical protein
MLEDDRRIDCVDRGTYAQEFQLRADLVADSSSSRFLATFPPRFGPVSQRTASPKERITSRLPSVEPSSTTITSLCGQVWSNAL